MMTEGRRNLLGWICMAALLIGFGLFTRWLLSRLPQEKPLATPEQKLIWTRGPGGSYIQRKDGGTFRGELVGVQQGSAKEGTSTCFILKLPDGRLMTFLENEVAKIHQSTDEPVRVEQRAVFTLRGDKTVEAFILEKNERYYRVRLVRNRMEMNLAVKDVRHVHLFEPDKRKLGNQPR